MRSVTYFIATLTLGLTVGFSAHAQNLRQGPGQRPTFEQLDKNGDGKIVASEVPAHGWQRLSRADTNKDNAVTKAEFEAARATNRGLGQRGQKVRPTFEQLDANRDGKLVQAEVPDRMWQRLQHADTNKDNVITKAEFDAMPKRPGRRAP